MLFRADIEIQGTERNKVAWMYVQKFRGSLKITDFQLTPENEGIGSIMLNTLFQFIDYRNQLSKEAEVNAKFNNPFMFSTIYGDLSWTDRENHPRLIQFYQKHGFTVSMNNASQEGTIEKALKSDY